jgi:hypothetical protein
MSEEFARFASLLRLSDQLVDEATKEELGDVARVLALHLARYQAKYGGIPMEESMDLLASETLDDDQARAMSEGFAILIAVIQQLATPDGPH